VTTVGLGNKTTILERFGKEVKGKEWIGQDRRGVERKGPSKKGHQ
jgi:hypothetical protein